MVQDYVDARNSQDFEAECDLYSDEFKEQLGATNCPAFVEEQSSGADFEQEVNLVSVRVKDDRATAELAAAAEGGGTTRAILVLERQDGDWLVTGFQ